MDFTSLLGGLGSLGGGGGLGGGGQYQSTATAKSGGPFSIANAFNVGRGSATSSASASDGEGSGSPDHSTLYVMAGGFALVFLAILLKR
jgi:hypothetical protein